MFTQKIIENDSDDADRKNKKFPDIYCCSTYNKKKLQGIK